MGNVLIINKEDCFSERYKKQEGSASRSLLVLPKPKPMRRFTLLTYHNGKDRSGLQEKG